MVKEQKEKQKEKTYTEEEVKKIISNIFFEMEIARGVELFNKVREKWLK